MAGSMNWTRRRYEIAAAVPVVAVFVALYAWAVPTEGPSRSADMFWLAVLFAVPTVLWLATSWLLVHHVPSRRDGDRAYTRNPNPRLTGGPAYRRRAPLRRSTCIDFPGEE